jgi:hypothetical protein
MWKKSCWRVRYDETQRPISDNRGGDDTLPENVKNKQYSIFLGKGPGQGQISGLQGHGF